MISKQLCTRQKRQGKVFEDRGDRVIQMPDLITKLQNPEPKMSFGDFIQRVEDQCIRTWDINWNGGSFLPLHANDMKIQEAVNLKCYIQRLQDCLRQSTTTFEDYSLQAIWSNDRRHGKHTRVGVVDSMISIFDSVPRMAGSCEEQAIGGQPSNLKTGGSIRVPEEEEISRTYTDCVMRYLVFHLTLSFNHYVYEYFWEKAISNNIYDRQHSNDLDSER